MDWKRTDWILFLWAPLLLGVLWGAWQGRRDRFSFSVLLVAPIFSTVVIVAAILAVAILNRIVFGGPPINPNNTDLVILLAVPFVYGFGFFLFGAVPALVGSAAGELGKLCVVSGIRRIGRRDIQGEPGTADHAPTSPEP
jgi:hypothetical protein